MRTHQTSRSFVRRLSLAVSLLGLISLAVFPAQAQRPQGLDGVETALAQEDGVRVVVALKVPEARTVASVRIQQIKRTQVELLDELSDEEFQPIRAFETIPGIVGQVTADGLETLLAQPEVEAIALDLPVTATLAESAVIINADDVWRDLGFSGAGVNIALLDTGVDAAHPDLTGSLVAQHCFSRGSCPPDNTDEGERALDENGHGTHVAGIISSSGDETGLRGIASDTGIIAVRVLGENGTGFSSDVLAGLDWVIANQAQLNVKIVNLSLGGGNYTGVCDQADANTMLYAKAIEAAINTGITVFAASGNAGLTDGMMLPACISGVVSVGSTYDSSLESFSVAGVCTDENTVIDQVACSSNSSPVLDLLAPGIMITSTAPGGGLSTQSGTSMSTAHASAVAALMLQADPDLAVPEITTILKETGLPVTDDRNGRITPRIDALAAVKRVIGEEAGTISGTVLLQGRTDHSGTDIFLSEEACSNAVLATLRTTTEPDGSFEIPLAPGQNYQCLQAVQSGYLIGQRISPGGDLGTIYLPGGDITEDGKINIFDLAFIGARFGSNDLAADITADGLVDIFDLVIAAGNYRQEGPVSNWE